MHLWGKIGKAADALEYHPLVCHMLDVGLVAGELWDSLLTKSVRERLSNSFGIGESEMRETVMRLAALHDLGKATPSFQRKNSRAKQMLEGLGFSFVGSTDQYHGDLTAHLVNKNVLGMVGLTFTGTGSLLHIKMLLGGHHGIYPRMRELKRIIPVNSGIGKWDDERTVILKTVFANLGSTDHISIRVELSEGSPFLILSGLISVADWIASAENLFPYAGDFSDISDYAVTARLRAISAIKELNWSSEGITEIRQLRSMFPFIETPYPLQIAAQDLVAELKAPGIVIIEAPMGEGKTEAALFLMERWNGNLGKNGAYIALPTQANANQMFTRVLKFLREASYSNSVNLALVHGHASMSDAYVQLRVNGSDGVDVGATEWFDYKRRGLLSSFGVGTIDQALLSVIPSKYFFVRLFGLAGKTVVIDEVHAYDLYTSTIIDKMLEWLSALGSNVIILSATLTDKRCKELLRSYSGKDQDIELRYPRISYYAGPNFAGSLEFPSAKQSGGRKQSPVVIRWCNSEISACLDDIIDKLADGGCAAIICNTVRRAQEVYQTLLGSIKDPSIDLQLFHSRFMFKDRKRIENECFNKYGRDREASKSILVATQVIEQSLDLDFDLMITEVAPVDLILQRVGRLHRHDRMRQPSLSTPELWIMEPHIEDGLDFGPSEFVYSRYTLLKSYLLLRNRERIQLPEDIRPLVEEAYSDQNDGIFEGMEDSLRESWKAMQKEARGQEDKAYSTVLPHPSDTEFWKYTSMVHSEGSIDDGTHARGSTRLGLPTVSAIALFERAGNYYLDGDGDEPVDLRGTRKANLGQILGNQIVISGFSLVQHIERIPIPSQWKSLSLMRHHHPLIFREVKGPNDTCIWTTEVEGRILLLDSDLGLMEVVD